MCQRSIRYHQVILSSIRFHWSIYVDTFERLYRATPVRNNALFRQHLGVVSDFALASPSAFHLPFVA